MKTMPIKLFLSEIKPVISRATSIQGFIITARTNKSTIQIKWGHNKIRKWDKTVAYNPRKVNSTTA